MRTVAVLPVKSFARAKQRITGAVADEQRRALAEAMVHDVLAALVRVGGLQAVIVVTAEDRAKALAAEMGVDVIHDPVEAGQSVAARLGIEAALADGAERALLVPGDCPALRPGEIESLLSDHRSPGVVIVPDRHGSGTNALLLNPPDAVAPSFGPGSFARHAATARGAEATVRIAQVASLGLDVDTPDDLTALRAALATRPEGAERTRGVLDRLVPAVSPG